MELSDLGDSELYEGNKSVSPGYGYGFLICRDASRLSSSDAGLSTKSGSDVKGGSGFVACSSVGDKTLLVHYSAVY